MAKKNMTFTIIISPCGESCVDYPVTDKEKRLILAAIENGECFNEVEELSDLYDRVMDAAREQIAEDLDLTDDDRDPDDFDYFVEFGEVEADG